MNSLDNMMTVWLAFIIFVPSHEWEFPFVKLESYDVPDLDSYDPGYKCVNCPRVFVPICGSNNRTYTNECQMKCRNLASKGTPVHFVRTGPCALFPFSAEEMIGDDDED